MSATGPVPVPSPPSPRPAAPFRDILCPTDLSPESSPALDHVRALAERFDSRVTLYHAVTRPDPEYPHWRFDQTLEEYWAEAAVVANHRLLRVAETLRPAPDLCVEKVVSPARALIEWIRHQRPDLVVMATHGRGGLSHLLLGSVTEQVIQHARRPVLCVRNTSGQISLPYRRLLVPTDLSPPSRAAFGHAAAIAGAFGAQVRALYVAPVGSDPTTVSEVSLWRFLRDQFPGVELATRTDQGRPWERIVAQAALEQTDLVVMACQGGDAVGERLLGSQAERVVRHAPCPVLVV